MMKMFKKLCACVLALVVGVGVFVQLSGIKDTVSALDLSQAQLRQTITKELEGFIEKGKAEGLKERSSRYPGSKAEYNSAIYLKQQLSSLKNFKAVNNASTKEGIQEFEFISLYDGNSYVSQNVIFKRESLIKTDRKVIIAAHYDSAFIYDEEESKYSTGKSLVTDGINDNAGSVAVLLALVKNLDKQELDYGYDIEVIFFGASTNNYAGSSYYLKGQTEEDAKNTLLMVNLDKIAVGTYNYAYVNEFKTSQEEYILETIDMRKIDPKNKLDIGTQSPNGLDYTHIALESDHAKFMQRNINVLYFFSGEYEEFMTFGLNESNSHENVTYTQNDNYNYILENNYNIHKNLMNTYNAVETLLKNDKFVAEMEKPNGLSEKYGFWTNEKLAVFITAVLLVVFAFIYCMIYWHLQRKSKKAVEDARVNQIVLKISSNLTNGEDNKDLNDAIDEKIKRDTDNKNEE